MTATAPAAHGAEAAYRLRAAAWLVVLGGLQGCASLDHGTSLEREAANITGFPGRVWLAPVRISDTGLQDSAVIADSLTLHLKDHLLQGYATDVRILPGPAAEADLIIRLDIDRYSQRQGAVGLILTLPSVAVYMTGLFTGDPDLIAAGLYMELGTLVYMVVGLPMVANQVSYSGTLRIEDGAGRLLGSASTRLEDLSGAGVWSGGRGTGVGHLRTRFVAGLLRDAAAARQSAGAR